MEENLEQHLTIQKVARQVLVSPVTLTRRFKEHTGQTFQEYHTDLRLKRATKLLQETDLSIKFISYYVGLKYGQLRALFLQKYGCSPGEFRLRKNRSDNDG
jgi:transcriptional regulator GlxA family with amidase domain